LDFAFKYIIVRFFLTRQSGIYNPKSEIGFTLIEVIIFMVLVAIAVPLIMLPLVVGIQETNRPEITNTAHYLAIEKMEELNGMAYAEIADGVRSPVDGFTGYEREVEVTEVDCSDLETESAGSGCKKVEVIVYHGDIGSVKLVTLVTDYAQ
jgi:type II secretory pathway pseudopilin PulG